jgi:two-component system, LytTR family, sensor kinase
LHVLYWVYAFVTDLHLLQQMRPGNKFAFINYLDAFNETAFQALSVYFCIYILVSRFFKKEKYVRFAVGILLTIIIVTILEMASQAMYVQLLMHKPPPKFIFIAIVFTAKIINVAVVTLVFVTIILAQHYYLKDKRNKQIEKNSIMSELDFLKAQMNPHFLFNALNSIYVLMQEDIKLAESTLLQFSGLLRYQLYECGNNETSLEKEVEFIKNYIDIEKVRNTDSVKISFNYPEQIPYFPLAPFILIPFVENAFKHLSRFDTEDKEIEINLLINNKTLFFSVKNSCDIQLHENENENENGKGIGLQNVRRRLELLYAGKYNLIIKREPSFFFVTLTI